MNPRDNQRGLCVGVRSVSALKNLRVEDDSISLSLPHSFSVSVYPLTSSRTHIFSLSLSLIYPGLLSYHAFCLTCTLTFAQIRTYDIALTIFYIYLFTLLIIPILLTDRDSFTNRARADNRL